MGFREKERGEKGSWKEKRGKEKEKKGRTTEDGKRGDQGKGKMMEKERR